MPHSTTFALRRLAALWVLGLSLGTLAWPAIGVADFTGCETMFPGGVAPAPSTVSNVDVCKQAGGQAIFAVRFDPARKTPMWTAHRLTPEQIRAIDANAGKMKRPRFTPDADITRDVQAVDRSYVRSGYSRGHMVPANDMSWDKTAYDATFHFSNVVPQKQAFNAGTWLGTENGFRRWVRTKAVTLWTFTGVYGTVQDDPTTLTHEGPTIGPAANAPTVPKCYYKVIVADQGPGQPMKAIALVYAWNDFAKQKAWPQAVTALSTVKARSGIDFLHGLDVENAFDAVFWGVEMPEKAADCL